MSARRLLILGGVLVALGAGYTAWDRMYARPIALARAELASVLDRVADVRRDTTRLLDSARPPQDLATGTLGGDAETVSARLRSALNRIATEAGLAQFTVTSRVGRPIVAPPERANAREFDVGRGQPEPIDFVPVSASLQGAGSLDAALRAAALVESQPWLKRLTRLAVEPREVGPGRAQASVSIDLETIYLPGVEPAAAPEPALAADPRRLALLAELDAKPTMTRPVPAKPVASRPKPDAEPTPTPPPPPPAPPAWRGWEVSGVMQGSAGPELWLKKQGRSSERRTLRQGERALGVEFVGVENGRAIVRRGDDLVSLGLGEALGGGRAVEQTSSAGEGSTGAGERTSAGVGGDGARAIGPGEPESARTAVGLGKGADGRMPYTARCSPAVRGG
jgi:hypothetical protein